MGIQEIIATILIAAGVLFMAVSALGLFRFPDFYTRLHSSGIGDSWGSLLIILGMMVMCGLKLITIKVFLVYAIIMLTNPVGTNLITMAGVHNHNYQHYNEAVRPDQKDEQTVEASHQIPAGNRKLSILAATPFDQRESLDESKKTEEASPDDTDDKTVEASPDDTDEKGEE